MIGSAECARKTDGRCAWTPTCPTRLAATIEKWWLEIEGFLQLGNTNARTEGYNRVIKQITRVACGFRNQENYEGRIMLHSAAHRAA